MIHSRAVKTCYYLRSSGYEDPIESKQTEWSEFIDWFKANIQNEKIFERKEAWTRAREAYFSKNNFFAGCLSFFRSLIMSKGLMQLVKEKIYGSDFPERMAEEWVRLSKLSQKEYKSENI